MEPSKLKKILFPFIFLGAISAICATILVGLIIYDGAVTNPTTVESIKAILPPTQIEKLEAFEKQKKLESQ
ncbi:hypothetical protein [Thorsellia anophelis]|uniref:Uncharacterized protein n=1 Tax=Thorsellia anophelis DSM 18579 TaxID=1123402 RepID=A0A1I0DW83_9GAMM|nr:hypothetical protein [Thorsellia anophelis]SET36934.1 hypothetical protein SAMN02583745_02159 [Thorsellia anophelis DSM 18579]